MRPPKLHAASLGGGSGLSDTAGGESGSSAKTDFKKFMAARLSGVWIWRKLKRVYELWILRMVTMVGGRKNWRMDVYVWQWHMIVDL